MDTRDVAYEQRENGFFSRQLKPEGDYGMPSGSGGRRKVPTGEDGLPRACDGWPYED